MTKTDIYALHDKAFNRVSAYVVLDKAGECVAKVAFKFPADGAGRLYAYVHWLGVPMVRGFAGGYGYDKRSAAVANAVRKMMVQGTSPEFAADDKALRGLALFEDVLCEDGGEYWDTRLRNAGFTVIQAI